MSKPNPILPIILIMIFLMAIGFSISEDIYSQPIVQDVESPYGEQIKAVLSDFFQLQHTYFCKPDTNVSALAELLIDSSDYNPSQSDITNIQRFFGKKGMAHPGYLTSQQASYLARQNPIQNTFPPGRPTPRPTTPPAMSPSYCQDSLIEIQINLKSVGQFSDGRWIVQYDYNNALWETTLRFVDNRWRISGVRLISGGRG